MQYPRIPVTGNAAERGSIRPKASGREGAGEKPFSKRGLSPGAFLPYRKYDASRAYSVRACVE